MVKGIIAFILFLFLIGASCLDAQSGNAWQYGYLIERINVPTDNGMFMYPVGTRVKLLTEKEGTMTVEAQGREFLIESAQFTRDVAEVQRHQESGLALTRVKKVGAPPSTTSADKLRSLEKRGNLVKAEMERANAEMHNTPHKNRPRTPEDRALNERHDAWKKQYEELHLQYTRILDQERQLRHENR